MNLPKESLKHLAVTVLFADALISGGVLALWGLPWAMIALGTLLLGEVVWGLSE